jgi:serine/threonine protein kinase
VSLPTIPGLKILAELGRGTTGVVYEARDIALDRRVALKIPRLDSVSEGFNPSEQFMFESRVLAALSEPGMNISPLNMVGEHAGQLYYVREFVDGTTLLQLGAKGLINLTSAIRILVEVAKVVERVHGQKLVHRNLSAENVLIANDGTPWLIGFGRVRRLHESRLSDSEPPFGAIIDVDVRGLQRMLQWVCQVIRGPIPGGLEEVLQPDSIDTPRHFAEALTVFMR